MFKKPKLSYLLEAHSVEELNNRISRANEQGYESVGEVQIAISERRRDFFILMKKV